VTQRLPVFVLITILIITVVLTLDARTRVLSLESTLNRPVAAETIDDIAAEALERANYATDLAFNLLGLFEALSLVVTVGGVVLTAFGFTRFNSAQKELADTRERVETEFENYRDRFEQEINARERELNKLRDTLEASAEDERQQTSNALLANALIPIGERQYRASDYEGARNTYQRALELDPQNPVVNQRLAYVYTHSGDLDKAEDHYERAIEREANFAPALAGLGFVYRRMGDSLSKELGNGNLPPDERDETRMKRDRIYNQAEAYLLDALKLSPRLVDDDGESWWGVLGGLYKRRGQINEAINAYEKVTDVTPQSSYGFGNLALLHMKRNEREKMLQMYERVERIARTEARAQQGNFWGYADLVTSSYAIGKTDQADEAVDIAIAIAPPDSPYMLSGLRDTLHDLSQVLAPEKVPPIQKAIDRLDTEMNKRQQQGGTSTDD
jgi:tetratricopeptide (TPR) repeat protein